MAKLPKMNLFIDAFNSDTVFLTEEELGLYMRMIFYAWTHDAYLPKDKEIIYCLPKKPNDALVDKILKLFWTEDDKGFYQKRMLKEYEYAMEVSFRASENAKKRYATAEPPQSECSNTITRTIKTNTITNKDIYIDQFKEFWELVSNKVSKGQANKNYQRLDKEWALQPKELAEAYNDYYNSISEKKYVKQPAFWLSAEKYLDEKPKEYSKKEEDNYKLKSYVEMYRKGIRLPIWSKQDLDKLEALAKQTN
tara:strand:- start:2739 stop:3491 length:753 start_codon:yes stop_codon:yes gene_type:complete